MKRVLIAGATGYLGRYLVLEFHRRGYRVRALTRSHEQLGSVRASVDEVHVGEATARGTVYLFGDGGFRMNPIHGRDLAAVCADAVEGDATDLAVGGPVIYTHHEIAEEAFAALNRQPRIRHVPVFLGRGLTRALRVLTPVRIHGPIEFLVAVLIHDMIAPRAGKEGLPAFFAEEAKHLGA